MSKPTIVVVNGAANEGFWAVHYLLHTGRFRVRATVRRPDGAPAARLRALEADGERCEVVAAANEDEAALRAAFAGATGIYGTSIYNVHARRYVADNPEEMAQGRALIAAARACPTLRQFVFQTMIRFREAPERLGLESPIHFRTKWQLEEQVMACALPWTLLRQTAYLRQVRFGLMGGRRLSFPYQPDSPLAFVAEEDLGKAVAAIFCGGEAFLHQTVKAVSELLTPVEMAARVHRCLPRMRPHYRRSTFLEQAFFDRVIVGLKPAWRYISQINANLAAGNLFDVDGSDLAFFADLVSPHELTRLEDWLTAEYGAHKRPAALRPAATPLRAPAVGWPFPGP